MNINSIVLGGNITRDVEVRYLESGTAVSQFSIANNRVWMKDGEKKEDVSFITCKAFAKTAENIAQYFQKGSPILVEGQLRNNIWEKDGQKKSMTYVIVTRFHFVGGKKVDKENKLEETGDINWGSEEE